MNTGAPDAPPPTEPSWTDLLTGHLPTRDAEPAEPAEPDPQAEPPHGQQMPEPAHGQHLPEPAHGQHLPEPAEAVHLPEPPRPVVAIEQAHPAQPAEPPEPAAVAEVPEQLPPHVVPPEPVTTVPGAGTDLEERIADVLRRPEKLRSVHSPIVDLGTGECVGFEAVVRVAEYTTGSPGPWMEAATRAGLAADLEAAMLAASLRARMTMPGNRFLAVHVSASVLASPAVRAVLAGEDDLSRVLLTPVSPGAAWTAAAVDVVSGLRGRGMLVGVVVTEAGRSELASVHAVRPDIVIVGGVLVRDVHADPVRKRLISALVGVSEDCGAAVLADGVESVDDARSLKDHGVQLAHGWLFGRARPGFLVPGADETAWLLLQSAAADTAPGGHAIPGPRPEPAPHPGADLRSHDVRDATTTGQPPQPQPR